MWTEVKDTEELEKALKLAKGHYQRDLLLGLENLSGSTLKGEAKNWAGKYAKSRRNLLSRLTKAGIVWSEKKGNNNRRILVIG